MRVLQGRESLSQEIARLGNAGGAYDAISGIRIEGRTMPVECKLESARIDIGDAIRSERMDKVDPNRKMRWGESRIAWGRREV
jgi:hypothetical protein